MRVGVSLRCFGRVLPVLYESNSEEGVGVLSYLALERKRRSESGRVEKGSEREGQAKKGEGFATTSSL